MSGSRRSEDAGDVPWPALVDLLTSVLIAFMFFILITTVAMSTMTMKMAEDISEKREQSEAPSETEVVSDSAVIDMSPTEVSNTAMLPPPTGTVASEDTDSLEATRRLREENELLKQQLAAMGASFAKSQDIKVMLDETTHALTLLFNANEAGTTPQSEAALARYVAGAAKGKRILITASEPTGVSFSQARERALTRAMVVRNVLLENGVEPGRINFRYESKRLHQSDNWVRLQVDEGQSGGTAQ